MELADVEVGGGDFAINNDGLIQGRGNAGAGLATAGDGLRFERTRVAGALDGTTTGLFTGTVVNTGSIASEGANGTVGGVRFVNGVSFQGTFDNSGEIFGVQNGVYFGNPIPAGGGDHTGGVFNNLEGGVISSDSRAFNIDGIGLEINNAGTILATGTQRNGTVYADSTAQGFTLNNLATGLVDAGEGLEGAAFSVELAEAGNDFTIDNSGAFVGRGQAGAGAAQAGDGLRFERARVDGGLDGSTTGLFTGTIDNSGTISSESTQGTTAGIRFVNGVSFQGVINNSGTISGAQNGLYFGNAVPAGGAVNTGIVNNLEGGVISSGSRAFNVDGLGLVVNNAGAILGTGDQRNGAFYADATADDYALNNLATGLIDAGEGNNGSGVSLQTGDVDGETVTFSVANSGVIAGRGDALPSGAAAGLRVFQGAAGVTADAEIVNSGLITSETSAAILIEGVGFTGTIDNSGELTGLASIDVQNALGPVAIVNSGALNGDVLGSGLGDTLAFTGGGAVLNGSVLGGVDTTFSEGSSTTITGAQTIEGDVAANGALTFVLSQDSLGVDGDLTFGAGSVVNVAAPGDIATLQLGEAIMVISETGAFTDNGVAVNVLDTSFLVDFDVAIGGVTVTANAVDLAAVSADGNVASFGAALTGAFIGGTLDSGVAAALDGIAEGDVAGFETAALGLLPAINEGVTREIFESQSLANRFISRRLREGTTGVWAQAQGRTANRDADSVSVSGYEADSFGFGIGADTSLSDSLTAGVAFNYANIALDSEGPGTEDSDINAYQASAYIGWSQEAWFINGLAGYTFSDVDSVRTSVAGPVSSESDVDGFNIRVDAGFDYELGGVTLTPLVGANYANFSRDAFVETGGLGLEVDADGVDYLDLSVGFNATTEWAASGWGVRPTLRAAYVYDVLGDETAFDVAFDGAPAAFALATTEPAQSRFEIGAGLGLYTDGGFTLSVEYDGEFADGYDSNGGFVRARFAF